VRDLGIGKYPYVVSQALGMKFAVSKLPFAALIGPDGTLRSKGLVNTREHLESLAESMETGIDTLQDYMKLVDNPPVGQAKEHAQ
jgi:methylamine dehydrogenase accessory protein MauD